MPNEENKLYILGLNYFKTLIGFDSIKIEKETNKRIYLVSNSEFLTGAKVVNIEDLDKLTGGYGTIRFYYVTKDKNKIKEGLKLLSNQLKHELDDLSKFYKKMQKDIDKNARQINEDITRQILGGK